MNVYDFDNTIYNGDSSVDFFKYCCQKEKKCLRIIPHFAVVATLYFLKCTTKEKLKSVFFSFVKYFDDIDEIVDSFWSVNEHKIKSFYKNICQESDIIISASPEFLLKPICKKLNVTLIATKVNKIEGEFYSKNCYGEEKVRRLLSFTNEEIEEFFSDSLSDYPLKERAKEGFLVKGDEIIPWDSYSETWRKKMRRQFLTPDFVTFVFLGVINVFNGVWISLVLSCCITSQVLAYGCGFLASMTIAYFLNSIFNFKVLPSFILYIKFAVNNIPNFLIQIFSVILFLHVLEIPKLIAYAVSATIAVPITFLLVKANVFGHS